MDFTTFVVIITKDFTMYSDKINSLIDMALADGQLTEAEKKILLRRAEQEGIDLDEFEMVLNAKLHQLGQQPSTTPPPAPKHARHGELIKCPACNNTVASYQGRCDACGYEFENIEANKSIIQLTNSLLRCSTPAQQQQVITTFPVPNSKADLIALLIHIEPRIRQQYNSLTDAYFTLYQTCIMTAKQTFPNDRQLQRFVVGLSGIEQHMRSLRSKRQISGVFKWAKEHMGITILVIVALLSTIIFGVQNISKGSAKRLEQQIQQLINENRLDEATEALQTADIYRYRLAGQLIEKYIAEDNVERAIHIFEHVTPKHCGMDYLQYATFTHDGYENRAVELIYDKLIEKGMYKQAWSYHPIDASERDSGYNSSSYYQFMVDVIAHLCKDGRHEEAVRFVEEYSIWFEKYSSNYKEYNYQTSKLKLLNIIKQYK